MKHRYSWAFLGLLVGCLCLCICLVPMLIGSPVGRMSFTALELVQGYQSIEGTDFAVERRAGRRERDVYLINLTTGAEQRIINTFSESSIAIVPSNGKMFLINETNGGGTDGWIS